MDYDIYILAGGKSSRMGSDKGLITYQGKPLISHLIDRFSSENRKITIVSKNPDYTKFNCPVIADIHPELGPLGGIYTVLKDSQKEYSLILSCDTPHVSSKLIQALYDQLDNQEVVIPKFKDQLHPIMGFYHVSCLPTIEKAILNKDLSVQGTIRNLVVSILDCDNMDPINFKNINSPKDL